MRNAAVLSTAAFAVLLSCAAVENTVYLDGSSVVQTGAQELLLQSHADEPSPELMTGGAIRLLPAGLPKTWSGAFRLQARGGFAVEVSFSGGRVLHAASTSSRGGILKWVDPVSGKTRSRMTAVGEKVVLL